MCALDGLARFPNHLHIVRSRLAADGQIECQVEVSLGQLQRRVRRVALRPAKGSIVRKIDRDRLQVAWCEWTPEQKPRHEPGRQKDACRDAGNSQ